MLHIDKMQSGNFHSVVAKRLLRSALKTQKRGESVCIWKLWLKTHISEVDDENFCVHNCCLMEKCLFEWRLVYFHSTTSRKFLSALFLIAFCRKSLLASQNMVLHIDCSKSFKIVQNCIKSIKIV